VLSAEEFFASPTELLLPTEGGRPRSIGIMIVIGEGFFWFPDGFVLTDGAIGVFYAIDEAVSCSADSGCLANAMSSAWVSPTRIICVFIAKTCIIG